MVLKFQFLMKSLTGQPCDEVVICNIQRVAKEYDGDKDEYV